MDFRALVENSYDNIARYDRDFKRTYANPTLGRLAGAAPRELIGKRPSDGPMPKEIGQQMEHAIQETFESGTACEYEFSVEHVGGRMHYSMHYVPEFGVDGKVEAVIATGRDITQLNEAIEQSREHRRRLEDLLDNLEEVYYSIDPRTGEVLYVSKAMEQMIGITRGDLEKDMFSFLRNVHPDDQQRVVAQLDAELPEDRSLELTYRVIDPDGKTRTVCSQMRGTRDEHGELIRVDGHTTDITAEIERQEASAKAQHLESVTDFKTNFLNMAAHELANPLTPLKIQMAMIKSPSFGPMTPKQRSSMELLERNINRLGLLVNDLLDAARLQSSRLRITPVEVNLRRIAEDVHATFTLQAKDSRLTLELVPGVPISAQVDEMRMTQVLFNLVHNAMKFTPAGGHIKILLSSDGNAHRIQVSDTGIGLEPDEIEQLFRPFSQVHDNLEVKKGGTGLGLYVVKGIMDQHGGSIDVSSPGHGKGTIFTVVLPITPVFHDASASVPENA